jgi:hypothetical protein
VIFYKPVNLCDRRACSASVAVGIIGEGIIPWQPDFLYQGMLMSNKRERMSFDYKGIGGFSV